MLLLYSPYGLVLNALSRPSNSKVIAPIWGYYKGFGREGRTKGPLRVLIHNYLHGPQKGGTERTYRKASLSISRPARENPL